MKLAQPGSSCAPPPGRRRVLSLVLILVGALFGIASGLRGGAHGPPAVWVADRDAHRVVALDADLVEVGQRGVRWPLEIEARRDRGFWVARAADGTQDGVFELSRHDAAGAEVSVERFGPLRDLATMDAHDALVVEERAGEDTAVWLVRADGARWIAVQTADVRCVAGHEGRILAGTDGGELLLTDADGTRTVLATRTLDLQVIDVAPGPPRRPGGQPDGWWLLGLDAQGLGRLLVLEEKLETRWEVETGLRPRHLVPVPGGERAWLADITAPRVRRFGPGGVLELDRDDLEVLGLDRGVAWPDGGLVLTAPGTLLRLDADGELRPAQGGFAYPVDLTRPRLLDAPAEPGGGAGGGTGGGGGR